MFKKENDGLMGRPKTSHCKNGHERTPENVDDYRACKQCRAVTTSAWKKLNREKVQQMRIRWKYGVSEKPDVCDVCGGTSTNGKRIAVDHDHSTKRVRGFLCNGCNVAIGMVKEDPDRLRRLAEYLEKQ